jgi:Tfp pilus assembly protein PilW
MAVTSARDRGCGVAELLLGMTLALVVLAGLLGALAVGSAALTSAGRRTEASDTLQLATEALLIDVRRAGFDPRRVGVEPLSEASSESLTLAADLDGDGTIDTASSEQIRYRCMATGGRLSRLVGGQSMPLAAGLSACRIDYTDDAGTPLAATGGLDAAERAQVRRITLTVGMTHAGGTVPTSRRLSVAVAQPW